jgi:hypothetical protein
LPTARAGFFPGGPAITVFASVINAGAEHALGCKIKVANGDPVNLSYQLTSATNAPIGLTNAAFNLAPGQGRSFILAFTPSANNTATDVFPEVSCDDGKVAAIPGVNTVFLSIGDAPGPDVLSIGATPGGVGIIDIPAGSTSFLTASAVNIGEGDAAGSKDAAVIVSLDTGNTTLPVLLQLCETDNVLVCLPSSPLGTDPVSTSIGDTPSFFAVFDSDQSNGTGIALDPANARVFLRFKKPDGTTISVTSAAVTVP